MMSLIFSLYDDCFPILFADPVADAAIHAVGMTGIVAFVIPFRFGFTEGLTLMSGHSNQHSRRQTSAKIAILNTHLRSLHFDSSLVRLVSQSINQTCWKSVYTQGVLNISKVKAGGIHALLSPRRKVAHSTERSLDLIGLHRWMYGNMILRVGLLVMESRDPRRRM